MPNPGVREPQQARSHNTLERILSSSTELISEQSYDDISISDIANRANISVGGFYSRFENKDALLAELLTRLGHETQSKITEALSTDWSNTSLYDLTLFIVLNNARLYEKYRGALKAIYLKTRVLPDPANDGVRFAYNDKIVAQLETLLLVKAEQIPHPQPGEVIRIAIACMTSMLRDAIVFRDTSLFPKPRNVSGISRHIANVVYLYLVTELP